MAKSTGDIIETPIKANFREGLSVLEYFSSTHGARKGLADTALKTADSGYLTRKLADVAQNVVVTMHDCGTTQGITKGVVYRGEKVEISLADSINGRVSLKSIVNPITDELIVGASEMITPEIARNVEQMGLEKIQVRTPMACDAPLGVCRCCYGMDMATGSMVEEGMAVGIIAAQSIGEPGTQLTMRTFHIGGSVSKTIEESDIKSAREGEVRFTRMKAVTNTEGRDVVLTRNGQVMLVDDRGREIESYDIPTGSTLMVKEGDNVVTGQVLCEWNPYSIPILSEVTGKIRFEDVVEGETMRQEREASGNTRLTIIDHKGDLHPQLVIEDKKGERLAAYPIPEKAYIEIDDGTKIGRGELLAKSSREATGTQDITGGLPRVTELFEARRPKEPAVMSEIDGVVELGERKRGKRTVVVRALGANGEVIEEHEHSVPQGKHLRVHKGDEVRAGEPLVDGALYPEDMLRINGEESVQAYLLGEVQNVYRSQSVTIDDKHIETILSQMMRKVQVNEPGDSEFLPGAVVDKYRFRRENERLRKDRRKPATGQTLLLGITKASLSSDSFISAASFQETTKVLTEAAIGGKRDYLVGLKENVILGHMVPTGTGFRDHYRTRVKKNIDFGEIGTGSGAVSFGGAGVDDAMDEMLSVDAAAAALGVDPARLGGAPLTGGGLADGGMAAPATPQAGTLGGQAIEPAASEEVTSDPDVDAGAASAG